MHPRAFFRPAALVGVTSLALGLTGSLVVPAAEGGGRPPAQAARVVDSADCPAAPATVDGLGSRSGGDEYFPADGNGGYDVQHYRVRDTYRPGNDRLTGSTVLRLTALDALTRFNLDLVLTADRVSVDGEEAGFSSPTGHELRVTPAQAISEGETVTVRVDYHGRPASRSADGVRPNSDLWFHRDGETVAMGEPQIGPWWFAANETPADKATYDIVLAVPEGQQAVSIGELVSHHTEDGWTTRHWAIDEPVTTYLAFFAAGRFEVRNGSAGGRQYTYAVSRLLGNGQRKKAFTMLGRTRAALSWLEDQFGQYPFDTFGGVVTGLRSPYALETATRPVYPYVGSGGTSLVVHEMAHQWFGDDVSLCRWRDVWLNEGFATFAQWLWAEDHGGNTTDAELRDRYDNRSPSDSVWDTQTNDPSPDDMWGWSSYVRGAMTLAALRTRIGTADFETLLRTWVEEQGGGHGTGPEFRALAEQISGEDLDTFFAHWLDDTAKPADTVANGLR